MTARRAMLIAMVVLVALPLVASPYTLTRLNYVYLYAIVVLGLVLLTGVVGLVSFGHAAFLGLGAYTTGYLTSVHQWSPWLSLPIAVFGVGASAWVIGAITLRMSGHYLALATLAWGISLYYLFGTLPFLGGFAGMSKLPALAVGDLSLGNERTMYYVIGTAFILCAIPLRNLLDSRVGRAIRSLRSGATLAETFGANAAGLKILVFVISAVVAGLAGWLYAHLQRFISPTAFGVHMGIEFLFMTVIGGAQYLAGALVGAAIFVFLASWLQDLLPRILNHQGNFELMVFGILMVVILQRFKEGLWPWLSRGLRPQPAFASRRGGVAALSTSEAVQLHAATSGAELLQVRHAVKTFGGLIAVDRVSFELRAGEILGLLGPNGAGKSTMFDLIAGVTPLTSGEVWLHGRRIDGLPARAIARLGVSRTFQHVRLVAQMTVLENAAFGGYLRSHRGVLAAMLRLNRAEENALFQEAEAQLERVGLWEERHQLAGSLPLGKQRLLEVARALVAGPLILFLDEPAAGLRFQEKQELAALLTSIRHSGIPIVLVEHDMDFVMNLADRLVVMAFGKKIADDAPARIQSDPAVIEAYLGAE